MWPGTSRRAPLSASAAVLLLVACSASSGDPGEVVVVFAAASLADAFGAVEPAFEAAHPDLDIELNLAGSSSLREQLLDGAPADVFASAGQVVMSQVVDSGRVRGAPRVIARNRMAIAVPVGNPAGVVGLDDFARRELLLGLCAPGVPCGDAALTVLERRGVEPSLDTEEADVRALLGKIAAGELDAGIVYASDVAAEDGVEGVSIDPVDNAVVVYPIAVVTERRDVGPAESFVDFVLSDTGRRLLVEAGFEAP